MAKFVILYLGTALACQVEGFPTELPVLDERGNQINEGSGPKSRPFERSVEGSLHLRPGSTCTVTADELEFIKAERQDVFKSIRVLTELAEPAEVPAAPVVVETPPSGSESSAGAESAPALPDLEAPAAAEEPKRSRRS